MIEYRLWKFGEDDHLITSYIETSFKAHGIQPRDEAWFRWKYEKSPYGKTIMACAIDGSVVAGCVAMGRGIMTLGNKDFDFALAYQNYVNEDYQRRGIFKKLIALVEDEAKKEGIKILYVFPNNKSLPGYLRMGYQQLPPTKTYLKVLRPWNVIKHLKDLKRPFVSKESNMETLKGIRIADFDPIRDESTFIPQWSAKYISWRFLSYPVGNYFIYDDGDLFFIARNGSYGAISCSQLLHIQPHHRALAKRDIVLMQKTINQELKPDILMVDISEDYPAKPFLRGYVSFKSHGHFAYKILTDEFTDIPFRLSKSGIDAHTY